jgi:hypothetical protein
MSITVGILCAAVLLNSAAVIVLSTRLRRLVKVTLMIAEAMEGLAKRT